MQQVSSFLARAGCPARPGYIRRRRRHPGIARPGSPPSHPLPDYNSGSTMRGTGGALAVAVAFLLVCCNADSHQESEGDRSAENYAAGGPKVETLEHPAGSRHVREANPFGYVPYLMTRRFDYMSPYGGKRDSWPMAYGGYYGEGLPKRNFDEIDRSGLDNFVRKRNFDEIDQTSMPFPYAKRFYHQYGPQYLDLDMPVSSFDKKRYRPDYPMDEIDLSHFPIGSKRAPDTFRLQH